MDHQTAAGGTIGWIHQIGESHIFCLQSGLTDGGGSDDQYQTVLE